MNGEIVKDGSHISKSQKWIQIWWVTLRFLKVRDSLIPFFLECCESPKCWVNPSKIYSESLSSKSQPLHKPFWKSIEEIPEWREWISAKIFWRDFLNGIKDGWRHDLGKRGDGGECPLHISHKHETALLGLENPLHPLHRDPPTTKSIQPLYILNHELGESHHIGLKIFCVTYEGINFFWILAPPETHHRDSRSDSQMISPLFGAWDSPKNHPKLKYLEKTHQQAFLLWFHDLKLHHPHHITSYPFQIHGIDVFLRH